MPRKASARFLFLLLALSLLAPVRAAAQAQNNFTYGPLPVFELHSGFWINLHHTLYHEARLRTAAAAPDKSSKTSGPALHTEPDAKPTLTPAEQREWDDAVAYYVSNYAAKDLLFSTELIQLKDQLGDFEDCDELSGRKRKFCDAGLPVKLTQVPGSSGARLPRTPLAGPRSRQPPLDHARRPARCANRAWACPNGLRTFTRRAGRAKKIRVDVAGYANWTGAYTTADPLRVTISSLDSRNQGAEALEVLFHEGSHGIAEPVQAAIIRECRQRDKAIPRDLWHALVFYTTGEVIRPVLGSSGATAGDQDGSVLGSYTPYALREGLYQRGWNEYFKLLQKFWQPYLDGRASFDDAIARMVSSL